MENQELPQKPFPKNMLLIGIALIIVIVSIGILIIYLLFTRTNVLNNTNTDNNSSNDNIENTDTVVSFAEEEDETTQWVGNATTATLPTGWSVVEYSTVDGMDMYAEGENLTFDGITGIEVYDDTNELVFYVKGVSGIGGTGACSELTVFEDTPNAYIQSITDENSYVGEGAPTINDLSASTYSDISFLGKSFRRVANVMYSDIDSNANTFSTGCGISANFVIINQISFAIMGEYSVTGNSYSFEINPNINSIDTLTKLDDVLNSFVAN